MRYRIKVKQRFTLSSLLMGNLSESYKLSKYYVQYKYNLLPFWVTITSSFDSKEQAVEHIELKMDVK